MKRFSMTHKMVTGAALLMTFGIYPTYAQDLYLGEYYTNTIQRVAPNGTHTPFAQPNVPSGIRNFNMSFDAAGNLFVARLDGGSVNPNNANNGVLKIDTAGNISSFVTMTGWLPSDVAFDAVGRVYVSSYSDGVIRRFSADGTSLGIFADLSADAYQIAFDKTGNLYATSFGGGFVRKFAANGTDLGSFAALTHATGITFDKAGNVYVSAQGSIHRYSATGADLGVFAAVSGMDAYDLAFHPTTGDLYVSDDNTNSIRRFDATGNYLGTFASGFNTVSGLAFAPTVVPEANTAALLSFALPIVGAIMLTRRRTVGCR